MNRDALMRRAILCSTLILIPAAGVAQEGVIRGVVRAEGDAPEPRLLEVTKNQDVCGESIPARDIVVDAGRVESAVAYVEGLDGEVAAATYRLSNTGCMFDPPVLVTTTGGTLVVDNHDDVLHNTHLHYRVGKRSRTVGNWGLAGTEAKVEVDRPLRRAGIIDVSCDAHPWMSAVIMVFDHPYFALSGSEGTFEIAGVPAGTHTVKMFHPVLGEAEQAVTVPAGGAATVTFVLKSE